MRLNFFYLLLGLRGFFWAWEKIRCSRRRKVKMVKAEKATLKEKRLIEKKEKKGSDL